MLRNHATDAEKILLKKFGLSLGYLWFWFLNSFGWKTSFASDRTERTLGSSTDNIAAARLGDEFAALRAARAGAELASSQNKSSRRRWRAQNRPDLRCSHRITDFRNEVCLVFVRYFILAESVNRIAAADVDQTWRKGARMAPLVVFSIEVDVNRDDGGV